MAKKKMIAIVIGAVVGGVVGYLYYRFIGCRSGTCFITRNPYISTIYWAVLGGLIANILK
jgi:ABC-type branched-subunit amino acid transport system permease subunit